MERINVFISYSSTEKTIGGKLKFCLTNYCGYETFIAHDDIQGGSIFEYEIIKKIQLADFFIPLISHDFKSSEFTDQETGIAISEKKKIIPIKLGQLNPYGFISKYHALEFKTKQTQYASKDNSKELVLAIAKIGISYEQYELRAINSLIYAFCTSNSFDTTNATIEVLSQYEHFTPTQLNAIQRAIKTNDQITFAWGLQRFKEFLSNKYKISIDE